MDSDTYELINDKLAIYFGRDGVRLVPDETGDEYDYYLQFNDHIELTQENIELAKSVVAEYDTTQWFDDEMRHVDEW